MVRMPKTEPEMTRNERFRGSWWIGNKTMDSSNTDERGFQMEPRIPSKTVARLSSLTGVFASQAYLIHATFFAHALTPVEVYVLDPKTHLHLVTGQIGNIEEVFHWNGLVSTILIAVLVFALGWVAARGTAKLLSGSGSQDLTQIQRSPLAPAVPASDIATASTEGIA